MYMLYVYVCIYDMYKDTYTDSDQCKVSRQAIAAEDHLPWTNHCGGRHRESGQSPALTIYLYPHMYIYICICIHTMHFTCH